MLVLGKRIRSILFTSFLVIVSYLLNFSLWVSFWLDCSLFISLSLIFVPLFLFEVYSELFCFFYFPSFVSLFHFILQSSVVHSFDFMFHLFRFVLFAVTSWLPVFVILFRPILISYKFLKFCNDLLSVDKWIFSGNVSFLRVLLPTSSVSRYNSCYNLLGSYLGKYLKIIGTPT